MLKSVYASLKTVLTKPKSLIPVFLVSLAFQLIFVYLIAEFTGKLLDSIVQQLFTAENISSYFFTLFASFPAEMLAITIFVLLAEIIGIYFAFFYARIALQLSKREKLSLQQAFNESNKNIGSIASIFVLFFPAFLVFVFLFVMTFERIDGTGIFEITTLIIGVLLFLLFLLYSFTIPIMAIESMKLKDAMKKASNFISANFLQAILFLLLLFIAALVVDFILRFVATEVFWLAAQTDLMNIALLVLSTLINIIISVIYLLGISFFYLEKK